MERKTRRLPELGERLRTYRKASKMSVDNVARRLGVSRAAVYRYEQGEVVKIETLQRLGELLNVPLVALLGAEVEFVSDGYVFFERIRQIESRALSTVIVFGPIAYVLTSEEYDIFLRKALEETYVDTTGSARRRIDGLMRSLQTRKASFRDRRLNIVSISSIPEIERFLTTGLVARVTVSEATSRERRAHAIREVRHIARLLRQPPMGVQIGLLTTGLPVSGFQIIREQDRTRIVNSPFRVVDIPNVQFGVASISDMKHVVQMHEQVTNELWSAVLAGGAAAETLEVLADLAESKL